MALVTVIVVPLYDQLVAVNDGLKTALPASTNSSSGKGKSVR